MDHGDRTGAGGGGNSAAEHAPGQMKGGGSAKEFAPGQMKGEGSSAKDFAPGQEKKDRATGLEDRTHRNKQSENFEGRKDSDRGMKNDREDREKNARSDREDKLKNTRSDRDENLKRDEKMKNERAREEGSSKNRSSTGASEGTEGRGGSKGSIANVSGEQKTRVKSVFMQHRVEPARDLNVSVNVGVALPHSVHLYPVPEEIVTIVPEYRDYDYIMLDDNRVAIVDPDTFEIVDIIVIA